MIVERKEYLDKLISWKDKRIIKIVTGVLPLWKVYAFENISELFEKSGNRRKPDNRD